MKKLLVLVLSIMFVAGAFTSAYATPGEVWSKMEGSKIILGGDARVRGVCRINHDTNSDVDDDNCYWDQRVRLTVTAQVGDAEVRTRFTTENPTDAVNPHSTMWDGTSETGGSLNVDYAYLHIPIAGIVIDAGRQKATFGNKFYYDDVARDRFQISAKVGDANIGVLTDKRDESQGPDGFFNNDIDDYGFFAVYKAGDIEGGALVLLRRDELVAIDEDVDGIDVTTYVKAKAGAVGVKGELSMKTDDYNYVTTDNDTQWGGFVSADIGMDAVTVGGLLAGTLNGFVADKHFAPTAMIGRDNPTAMGNFGARGDSLLGVISASFKATPELSVNGKAAYAHYESYPDTNTDSSAIEFDAGLKFDISKGVTYSVDLGYLIPNDYSSEDDNVLSVMNKFAIDFN
jgi:hypothetical protein